MSPFRFLAPAYARAGLVLCLSVSALCSSGCINSLVMFGKTFLGDPVQTSSFEMATHVNLKKEEKRILVHCSAPPFVSEAYATLSMDLQLEVNRRMKRHDLQMLGPDAAASVIDRLGGKFDAQAIAREVKDADYIVHVQVDRFTYKEDSSPNLFRGNAGGRIMVFEVRSSEGEARHAVDVFDQQFHVTYPGNYPVPVDQTPKNVFIRRFIDHLADCIGASFYDVNRSSLYATD